MWWTFAAVLALATCQIPFHFNEQPNRPTFFQTDSLIVPPLRADREDVVVTRMLIPLSNKFMVGNVDDTSTTTTSDEPVEATTATMSLEATTTLRRQIELSARGEFLKVADETEEEEVFHEGTLDPNGKLAVRLAWKAFEEDVNERIEGEFMYVPLRVLGGNGQIVSGMLYEMSVLAGVSNCSRYEVSTYLIREEHCVYTPGNQRGIFNVLISERSSQWLTFIPDSARVYSLLERRVANDEII